MKKLLTAFLLCSFTLAVNAETATYTAEAKKITGAFFQELKGELSRALKIGGPVTAVSVCRTIAPAIAQKHSEISGWDVARTSLKLRNPENAPDAWETKVLLQFEERRAQGESADTLVHSEMIQQGDAKYFRFIKAIVMPPQEVMPCLQCHGEKIDSATKAAIEKLYPEDKAYDYKPGQIRGAFTLKKQL